MRSISLQSISLQNFKSFRHPTEVDLVGDSGLTLISGDNRAEPRLQANGAGKSTIFDALCFCLYGTSVRGVRIGDLVARGEKSTRVLAVLKIDGEEVQIRRQGPPGHVFLDDRRVEQEDVDRLLGMSRQRFLNSVIFGQAAPLFIDLPIPARGELLDDVLDLQLWMRAADRASRAAAQVAAELGRLRVDVGRAEGSLSSLESLEEVQRAEAVWEAERQDRMEALLAEMEEVEGELQVLQTRLTPAESGEEKKFWEKYQEEKERLAEIEKTIDRGEEKKKTLSEDIAFFQQNSTCPVCAQDIGAGFAEEHLREQESALEKLQLLSGLQEREAARLRKVAEETYASWRSAAEANRRAEREQAAAQEREAAARRALGALERRVEAAAAERNPHAERARRVAAERAGLEEDLRGLRAREESLGNRAAALEFWKQGFRRVRLYCVGRVLRQLEVETMSAAHSLGLVGWTIAYATEVETKSGTTKTGVQIEVASPVMAGQFPSWSGGEGQRVRLCVALGLASLIQRWSGVRWDVEIFDEPTAWLSESGIEDLLELLKSRADAQHRRIFLCDHRALTYSGFSDIVTVIKDSEGSRIGRSMSR